MNTKSEDVLKAAIEKHLQQCQMTDGLAGDLLTFKKGTWVRGKDKIVVPEGTMFRPNVWEFWHGWQKFVDGHVAGLKLCRVTEGPRPDRKTLDSLDEEMWETGRDPWQKNSRFVAQDMDGDLVTFSTQTDGGRWACDELLKAYFKDKHHPDLWPVVAIKTAYFTSPDYGRIAKPSFDLVDWAEPWATPSGTLLSASSGNGTKAIEALVASLDELENDIPF